MVWKSKLLGRKLPVPSLGHGPQNEARSARSQDWREVRALREEQGLTLEKLAYGCDFSKGQLSTIEKGLAVPTASTAPHFG